jgi:cell division septation protein DedD
MRNTNNETGEYELVIGNKQLLSGFFIVVVLCTLAFVMGYVVGQNSPRNAKLGAEPAAAASPSAEARPQPASPALSPPATPSAPQPDAGGSSSTESAGASEAASAPPTPQPTTQPAREPAAASSAAPQPAPADPAQSSAGAFWQVFASKNQDSAQALVQTLKDKGFPAQLSPGPDSMTRVIVGPYADTATLGRAKTALENAGFQPRLRK